MSEKATEEDIINFETAMAALDNEIDEVDTEEKTDVSQLNQTVEDEDRIKYSSIDPVDQNQTIEYTSMSNKEVELSSKNKKELIRLHKEITKNLNLPEKTKSWYKLSRKAVVIEELAVLYSQGVTSLQNSIDGISDEQKTPDQKKTDEKVKLYNDFAINALYSFNLLASKMIEKGSENFSEKIGGTCVGLTDKIKEKNNKEELKEILREIWLIHGNVIKPLLSPLTMLASFNLRMMMETYKKGAIDEIKKS